MGVQKIAEMVVAVDVMIIVQPDVEVVEAAAAVNSLADAAVVAMADAVEKDATLIVKADAIGVAMANAVEALAVQIAQKHVI